VVSLLALLLLVAAALRLHALDLEPWFDEVATHLRDGSRPLNEIVTSYESQNKHVLYSVLARLSIDVFGDSTAALRAPAAAFGVLGVLALYLFARAVAPQGEALLAAAVLAFSYHHVWFSQNARGYTMLLFWTLVASLLLVRAMAGERRRTWVAYACVLALGAWTHLTMLFVGAGHLLLYGRRLPQAHARAARRPRGLAWGFALALALVLLAYAPMLPSVVEVSGSEGRGPRVPRWKTTEWALGEMATALRTAFPMIGVALAALGVAGLGVLRFWRERPVVLELALYPVAIAGAVIVALGHDLWPRFFFFALGFAILLLVAGTMQLGELLARAAPTLHGRGRALGTTIVLLVVALEATIVPRAWQPKQSYREAIALVGRERRPGDEVLVVGPARHVLVDFYRTGWRKVQSLAEVQEARARAPRTWLVYTFPIAMAANYADIAHELDAGFELVGRFPGTLHGGDVLVWRTTATRRFEEKRHASSAGD
jgi:uncharacterized membrane protein